MSAPQQPGRRRLLPTTPAAPPPDSADSEPTILVVEDDPALGGMVQEALQVAGYQVVVALGLAEAEAALTGSRFDLVLADSLRKSTTGQLGDRWSALKRIRALAGVAPVVITTAYRADLFADYHRRGFRDLLPKPFTLDCLLATVRRNLAASEGGVPVETAEVAPPQEPPA